MEATPKPMVPSVSRRNRLTAEGGSGGNSRCSVAGVEARSITQIPASMGHLGPPSD